MILFPQKQKRQLQRLGADADHFGRRLDFRHKELGRFSRLGDEARRQYSRVDLHAGLICLNGPPGMDLDMMTELFAVALDELARRSDLTNRVIEVTQTETEIHILRYALPRT